MSRKPILSWRAWVLRHQNLHGLEFIAYDFLLQILEVSNDVSMQREAEQLIDDLPPSWRSIGAPLPRQLRGIRLKVEACAASVRLSGAP